jgi:hypothetical protein
VQVPIARGHRLAGESKMNLPALVMHGICALSVWSDVIVSRLFVIVAGLMAAIVAGLAAVISIRLLTTAAIPGWATASAGLLVIGGLLLGIVSLLLAVFVLGNRSGANFLPHRDWRDYVLPSGRAGRRRRGAAVLDPVRAE